MQHRTDGAQSITTSSGTEIAISVKSSILNKCQVLPLVAIGTEPTATDYIVPDWKYETLGITKASQRVESITNNCQKDSNAF